MLNKLVFFIITFICFSGYGKTNDSLDIYLSESNSALENYDYATAIFYVDLGINYKVSHYPELNLGQDYIRKGNIYKSQSLLDSALVNYEKAQIELIGSNIDSDFALVLLQKGRIYKNKRNYSDALKSFNQALMMYTSLQDSLHVATVKLNIGNVFKGLKKYDSALKNYNEAVVTFKQLNLEQKTASCYNNIGNLYRQIQNYDSAFYYLYETIALREKTDNIRAISYAYHNISNLHQNVGNYDSALFYINKSLQLKFEFKNESEIYLDYLTLGEIYNSQKDYKNAIYYFETALQSKNLENNIEVISELNKLLADSYFHENQFKDAAVAYHTYIELNDSINRTSYTTELEKELVNYETFKDSLNKHQLLLEKEIKEIEQNNSSLNTKLNKNNIIYLIVILVILILLGGLLYRSFRKRLDETNDHKIELEKQNDELKRTLISKEEKETLLKEIHHRVKNNLQIINSLIRLQSTFMTEKNFSQKLVETENRIRSMALVHEKLYKSDQLSKLDAATYIKELTQNILESFDPKLNIEFKYNIDSMQLSIDTLIPLGLIINEIVSNSIKYAFTDRKNGVITIVLNQEMNSKTITFNIADNGIGADLTYDELSEDSLGMELIQSLSEQLDGKLKFNTDTGFNYFFIFHELK